MSSTIVFDQATQMQRVCGVNDRNVPYIELLLNGELFVHGNSITYRDVPDREGSGDEQFLDLMMRLKRLAQEREDITEPEIFMEYQALVTGRSEVKGEAPEVVEEQHHAISVGGKVVYPKSV